MIMITPHQIYTIHYHQCRRGERHWSGLFISLPYNINYNCGTVDLQKRLNCYLYSMKERTRMLEWSVNCALDLAYGAVSQVQL